MSHAREHQDEDTIVTVEFVGGFLNCCSYLPACFSEREIPEAIGDSFGSLAMPGAPSMGHLVPILVGGQ